MRRVLIDSEDKIIYEGGNTKALLKVLLKHPSDVTEDDEVKYEDLLRTLKTILQKKKHTLIKKN